MKSVLRIGSFLMILSALLFIGCDEQDKIAIEKSASVFDIEQGKASIQQSNLRFMSAFKDKDSVEVANCFMKKGVIMIDGFPSIEGREAIAHFFSQVMANGVKKYDLETKNIWGDSSILVEEGVYKLTGKEKKKSEEENILFCGNRNPVTGKCFAISGQETSLLQPLSPEEIPLL